jgi:predicted nucleic acid-binding protein
VPEVFADTFYWIALLNPTDKWHQEARAFSQTNPDVTLVTTDAVLMELLNYFAKSGDQMRRAATACCDEVKAHVGAFVLPQTQEAFARGLDLYKARPDKGYSITDCISMIEMRGRQIHDVLTHDRHFRQEGFNVLFI